MQLIPLADGFLQPKGHTGPGIGHFNQQRPTDQGSHRDARDREHRQQGIGQGMAQHHIAKAHAFQPRGADILLGHHPLERGLLLNTCQHIFVLLDPLLSPQRKHRPLSL